MLFKQLMPIYTHFPYQTAPTLIRFPSIPWKPPSIYLHPRKPQTLDNFIVRCPAKQINVLLFPINFQQQHKSGTKNSKNSTVHFRYRAAVVAKSSLTLSFTCCWDITTLTMHYVWYLYSLNACKPTSTTTALVICLSVCLYVFRWSHIIRQTTWVARRRMPGKSFHFIKSFFPISVSHSSGLLPCCIVSYMQTHYTTTT